MLTREQTYNIVTNIFPFGTPTGAQDILIFGATSIRRIGMYQVIRVFVKSDSSEERPTPENIFNFMVPDAYHFRWLKFSDETREWMDRGAFTLTSMDQRG